MVECISVWCAGWDDCGMVHCIMCTVEPPNKWHFGAGHVVLCKEVVLFSEVENVLVLSFEECPLQRGCPLSQRVLYWRFHCITQWSLSAPLSSTSPSTQLMIFMFYCVGVCQEFCWSTYNASKTPDICSFPSREGQSGCFTISHKTVNSHWNISGLLH